MSPLNFSRKRKPAVAPAKTVVGNRADESRAARSARVRATELMKEAKQLVKRSRQLHRQLRQLLDRQGPGRIDGKDGAEA